MNKVTCPKCNGTGIAPLSKAMAATLGRLRKRFTAKAIQLKTPHEAATAINMRLLRLFRLGLVSRERKGRFWIYKAKN